MTETPNKPNEQSVVQEPGPLTAGTNEPREGGAAVSGNADVQRLGPALSVHGQTGAQIDGPPDSEAQVRQDKLIRKASQIVSESKSPAADQNELVAVIEVFRDFFVDALGEPKMIGHLGLSGPVSEKHPVVELLDRAISELKGLKHGYASPLFPMPKFPRSPGLSETQIEIRKMIRTGVRALEAKGVAPTIARHKVLAAVQQLGLTYPVAGENRPINEKMIGTFVRARKPTT